jgi:hypothetical protein
LTGRVCCCKSAALLLCASCCTLFTSSQQHSIRHCKEHWQQHLNITALAGYCQDNRCCQGTELIQPPAHSLWLSRHRANHATASSYNLEESRCTLQAAKLCSDSVPCCDCVCWMLLQTGQLCSPWSFWLRF